MRLHDCAWSFSVAVALATAGCVQTASDRGIGTQLEAVDTGDFVRGETLRRDVLEVLGPPSQVLDLHDETAFYYVQEEIRSRGLVLILYNQHREVVDYDRAVFFFDEANVLVDYALTLAD